MQRGPRIVVLSSLWPSPAQPIAGRFIQERMARVARVLPVTIVAPMPWFPFQSLLRRARPQFRPVAPRHERQGALEVFRPRFLSIPGLGKRFDGLAMALGAYATFGRLRRRGRLDLIDAHFGYPDGFAAARLGAWLDVPVTITLRGSEARQVHDRALREKLRAALAQASRVFAVAEALRAIARALGVPDAKSMVVGNGVELRSFERMERSEARRELGLPQDAKVLVSVGGLVERKGFHRVIECLPALRARFPGLRLLIAGGAGPEGDWTQRLHDQVAALGLADCVRFLGVVAHDRLRVPLYASDAFVLATRNEGWANVFLEAMACGLPVVTTRVGGNAEVVRDAGLGTLVPFDDREALTGALDDALSRDWDRGAIRAFAETNAWDSRIATLVAEFTRLAPRGAEGALSPPEANRI